MTAQVRLQGRHLGGRPPYGYRLADAGPHPNAQHAAWGRRLLRLDPDPETAPYVRWVFVQRLAGHSAAGIARTLNALGIPSPSAHDPDRNRHRHSAAWTVRTVAAILANPRYTGRQVLAVWVADQEPELAGTVAEVHDEVTGLLDDPRHAPGWRW
jgi:site-specific DNA recombinase